MPPFLQSGRRGGFHVEASGIHGQNHVGHQASLAGCAPALKQDDHGNLRLFEPLLKLPHFLLKGRNLLFIFLLEHDLF